MGNERMLKGLVLGTTAILAVAMLAFVAIPVAGASSTSGPGAGRSPPTLYAVTFTEVGLSAGQPWNVVIGPAPSSAASPSPGPTITVSLPNGTYPFAVPPVPGFSAAPSHGNVTVAGAPVSVSIVFTPLPYTVTFSETGLPAGTPWSVSLSLGRGTVAQMSSSASSLFFPGVGNGTHAFAITPMPSYTASPARGTVNVSGGPASVAITFSANVRPSSYPVTFTETGLPAAAYWTVAVSNAPTAAPATNTSSLTVDLRNGTYLYQVLGPRGFSASPSNGNFTVAGAALSIAITFAPLRPPTTYAVTFTESGLPAGTPWTVSLSGATSAPPAAPGSSITLQLPNGTYAFAVLGPRGYVATPSGGNVTVAGAAVSVAIAFSVAPNTATFTESGLLAGTRWSVAVGGGPRSVVYASTTTTIVIGGLNGTYAYAVLPVPGYSVSPSGGNLTVSGGAVGVSVTFTLLGQLLTFSETGLPTGTAWGVSLGGGNGLGTTGGSITFIVPNGNYTFVVGGAASVGVNITIYAPSPSQGNVTVAGANVVVAITFSPVASFPNPSPYTGNPGGSGPGTIPWWQLLNLVQHRARR